MLYQLRIGLWTGTQHGVLNPSHELRGAQGSGLVTDEYLELCLIDIYGRPPSAVGALHLNYRSPTKYNGYNGDPPEYPKPSLNELRLLYYT